MYVGMKHTYFDYTIDQSYVEQGTTVSCSIVSSPASRLSLVEYRGLGRECPTQTNNER